MSRALLQNLNGSNTGNFHRWLENFHGEPRIAWYPSAGQDYRDMLFLHEKYATTMNPAFKPEPQAPDIFLHTDYFPWSSQSPLFLDNPILHADSRTKITVKSREELPRCDLPLDRHIVAFPQGGAATGRVFFLELAIDCYWGTFSVPLLYAFVENAAFCAQRMIPHHAALSHIVHVRYGAAFGGSKSTGMWLIHTLCRLQCECFITDGHHSIHSGDSRVFELYPMLDSEHNCTPLLQRIRTIKGNQWSNHGNVSWYRVS